jgi:hypothetical protein
MRIDWLFKNLNKIIDKEIESFSNSIIYLDSEQLYELYSSLFGLKGRPSLEVQQISGTFKANLFLTGTDVSGNISKSFEISDIHLLKAILEKIEIKYKHITNGDDVKNNQKQKVWLKGELKNRIHETVGVDLNIKRVLNTEFYCHNIRFDLPVLDYYVSSIYRSLLVSKKGFNEDVKVLGYIHNYNEVPTGTADAPKTYYIGTISPIFIFRINK